MELSLYLAFKIKGGTFCFLTQTIDLKNAKIKSSSPDVWKENFFYKFPNKY